jgi:uncharacterized membrane protein
VVGRSLQPDSGRNLERLAALSDGVFAVAMTLLVLDLHIPTSGQVHGERELLRALGALGPQWVAYGMSFLTLGIVWAGQQTQLNHIRDGSRDLTWIHLAFCSQARGCRCPRACWQNSSPTAAPCSSIGSTFLPPG